MHAHPWDIGFRIQSSGSWPIFDLVLVLQHPQRSQKHQTTTESYRARVNTPCDRLLSQSLACKPLKILVLDLIFGVFSCFSGYSPSYCLQPTAHTAHNSRIWARFYIKGAPIPLSHLSLFMCTRLKIKLVLYAQTSCDYYIQRIHGWMEDIPLTFMANRKTLS